MPRGSHPVSNHPCGFSLNLYADRIAYLAPYVEEFQDVFSSVINCDLGGYQATFEGNRGQIAKLLATCRAATGSKIIFRLWPTTTTGFQRLVWCSPEGVYANVRLPF